MAQQEYDLGMIGLGTMGCNLVLNMAEHGFAIAGYDRDAVRARSLQEQGRDWKIFATTDLKAFVDALRRPRVVMILVPAGAPVDEVLREVLPFLRAEDIVIDGGNSHFADTRLRQMTLAENKIYLLGVGISGGGEGARHGPSIMPGGAREAYERVRRIFEAIAAQVDGEPCVAYLGPGPAGHYVKMVHNGIEYGLMRLLSESYDLMHRGLGLNNDELHAVYEKWNQGELNGFLMEITAAIFLKRDEATGKRLIDVIRPVARQKGTGMWSAQEAMELQVPAPCIDMAVAMRNLSALEPDRQEASRLLQGPEGKMQEDRAGFLEQLQRALHAGMLLTYSQGMDVLRAGSKENAFGLDLEKVAEIWRGGCIIRSALLEPIRAIYRAAPELDSLLLDPGIARELSRLQESLRYVVRRGAEAGISVSVYMAALGYYDAYRSARMPANLIQAQRDYFGAHTYERIDAKGVFHTKWSSEA